MKKQKKVTNEEPKDLDQLISELDNKAGKKYKEIKDNEATGFIKPGFGNKKKHTLNMQDQDDQPKRRTIIVQKKVFLNETGQISYDRKQKPEAEVDIRSPQPGETSISRNLLELKHLTM